MSDVRSIEDLFGELVELETPEEREAYLDSACGDDAAMRGQLDKLIAAHERAGSFLQDSDTADQTVAFACPDLTGSTIGPYKLLQKIGEGGMGVVYMAEQKKPVKRRVALKIIKPGMDTLQVIARFEAERQALALMNHPNIAKVLEAGATDTGRPFFVMELVKGVPITEYSDQHKLDPRERLELFISVCQAVQHAHQKGIIHRDLKPSNVLVAKFDDKPVVKVIDFGVAKATNQELTERTMFTQFGQIVGTLEYMSPEQAAFNQLDIDTRSDIYSLGVLLYELLTGETPFDRTRLQGAALNEILRVIREEEPPKPSVRLRSSETLSAIAEKRQMEPRRLGSLVQGDLDCIVMKALDKERVRRYESAATLGDDLGRYLSNEPVVARPPSTGYRAAKFALRNKRMIVVASAFLLLLVGGIVATSVLALHARKQRQIAITQKKIAQEELLRYFLAEAFMDADGVTKTLLRAEECGLPDDQKSLIRALGCFYQQDLGTARNELKSAPDGIIKASISAWVETLVGNELTRHRAAKQLEGLKPQNAIDAVFKAQYYCFTRPTEAIGMLEQFEAHRQTGTLGHVVYGLAKSTLARKERDAKEMELAVREVEAALTYHPENPYVAAMTIQVLVIASRLAKEQNDLEQADDYIAKATELAPLANGTFAIAMLYRASGDHESYLSWLEQRLSEEFVGVMPLWYAPVAAFLGEPSQAIQTLEAMRRNPKWENSKWIEIGLAQLYAVAGNEQEVLRIYDELQTVESDDARMFLLYALALLPGASLDQIAAKAAELQEGEPGLIPYKSHLAYWAAAGSDDAEAQLRQLSPERADFEIGFLAYVAGDYPRAQSLLHRYVLQGGSWAQSYWARYLLGKIESMKEGNETEPAGQAGVHDDDQSPSR